jgi:outer membrane protein TolC
MRISIELTKISTDPLERVKLTLRYQKIVGFQAICAALCLCSIELGSIEAVQAIGQDGHNSSSDARRQDRSALLKLAAEPPMIKLQSLTLKETIAIAFRNNNELRAARLAVEKSQVGVGVAGAARSVQVELVGNLGKQGSPAITNSPLDNSNNFNNSNSPQNIFAAGNNGGDNETNVGLTVQATYNLLNAGRDAANVRMAEAQVNTSRLDLDRLELQIKGSIINAYYDLQAADLAVANAENAVKEGIVSLNDVRLPESAKPTPKPDRLALKFVALDAQLQLDTANQTLITAIAQQKIARRKISQLLSVEDNTEFKAADPVKELGTWNYSLADSLQLAYKNRAELKQHLVNRQMSEQQQVVHAANGTPIVNLVGNYNVAKNLSSGNPLEDGYSIGVQFNWSLWDGGAAQGRSAQEQINLTAITHQFKTTQSQVRFEVEQSYHNLLANKQNITIATQSIANAKEVISLAPMLLRSNAIKPADATKAQISFVQAQNNLISAILNYNRSLINLDLATGRKLPI